VVDTATDWRVDVDALSIGCVAAPRAEIAPLVKWAGGKRALAPMLRSKLPVRITSGVSPVRYFEPFAGGCALHLHMRSCGDVAMATISDTNADLIRCYQAIATDPDAVADAIPWFADDHCVEKYHHVRNAWNGMREIWPAAKRAAALLYLNKTCFNGLWRVNAAGAFNVPMGYREKLGERVVPKPSMPTREELHAFADAMIGVDLIACGFVDAMTRARPGDVIYADPPYLELSPTANFSSYTPGGFGLPEQEMLAAIARELVKRGVFVMLSNADVPIARDLYPSDIWNIETISASRRIAANGSKRGVVTELVITPRGM
jgi:DNA adenine methylase